MGRTSWITYTRAWLPQQHPTMASPHSNGFQSSYPYQPKRRRNEKSLLEDLPDKVERVARVLWSFARGRGRRMALAFAMDALHQVRRNLTARRILSFPHLLVVLWVFVMLWGERWVFHSTVERCDWSNWESWVRS